MVMNRIVNYFRSYVHLLTSTWGGILTSLPNINPYCRWRLRYWQRKGYQFADSCLIYRNVYFLGRVVMGRECSISDNCFINGGNEGVELGNYVMIAPNCVITAFNHGVNDLRIPMLKQPWTHAKIVIEDDVWIGSNCSILAGVRIGKGSIVGAGAVVTKNVAPYSIVGGVPARLIRSRRNDSSIRRND